MMDVPSIDPAIRIATVALLAVSNPRFARSNGPGYGVRLSVKGRELGIAALKQNRGALTVVAGHGHARRIAAGVRANAFDVQPKTFVDLISIDGHCWRSRYIHRPLPRTY